MKKINKLPVSSLLCYGYLAILVCIAAFPLFWIFISSIKQPGEIISSISFIPQNPGLHYYIKIFTEMNFQQNLMNSLVTAVGTTAIALLVASHASYGIVRYFNNGRKGRVMTRMLITTYMFPSILLAIPYSVLIGKIGLQNSRLGLILTYLSFSIPFAVWMLIGFFRTVPMEIEESAMVDGASPLKTFYLIALPIVAPGVAATGIYTFINAWNEVLFALILTNSTSKMTAPVYMSSLIGAEILDWGVMMASSMVFVLPSLFFFMLIQKKIAGGLTQGAIK